jgi:hypothetical protein
VRVLKGVDGHYPYGWPAWMDVGGSGLGGAKAGQGVRHCFGGRKERLVNGRRPTQRHSLAERFSGLSGEWSEGRNQSENATKQRRSSFRERRFPTCTHTQTQWNDLQAFPSCQAMIWISAGPK